MRVLVFYTSKARKDLKSLSASASERIVQKVSVFAHSGDPLSHSKLLASSTPRRYRYRVGDYRVVFSVDEHGVLTVLTILRVQHRKDIYR